MQKLVSGIHQFQKTVFSSHSELFKRLAKKQNPVALFITCADSRISPNMLTQTDPGDIFILRNAGNIVPPYGAHFGGEAATIEYAISVLKVRDAIVCGHSHCGAMEGLLQPEKVAGLAAVTRWLDHAESTRRIIKENYGHLAGPALLTASIEENVLVQLENLRTHPSVAAAIARGQLNLHGWVYKIETGEVFVYDPETNAYRPLSGVVAKAVRKPRQRVVAARRGAVRISTAA